MDAADQRRAHWQDVYTSKAPADVSWFQKRPDVALSLIEQTGVPPTAAIADIGGGASTLIDHLLSAGHSRITVLDISGSAIDHAQNRLGGDAKRVSWVVADITQWRARSRIDLWHDRAVLHFLVNPDDQRAYADALRHALAPDGWVIIAGFAPGGPLKCSGLQIVQHDAASLQALLGAEFEIVTVRDEIHHTPSGAEQAFRYHLFRRKHPSKPCDADGWR